MRPEQQQVISELQEANQCHCFLWSTLDIILEVSPAWIHASWNLQQRPMSADNQGLLGFWTRKLPDVTTWHTLVEKQWFVVILEFKIVFVTKENNTQTPII